MPSESSGDIVPQGAETLTKAERWDITVKWPKNNRIFEAYKDWKYAGTSENKEKLIKAIEENPELAREIRRVSQADIRQEWGKYGLLDNKGRICLYRGTNAPDLAHVQFQPYDSFSHLSTPPTDNEEHNFKFIVGLRIPVSNIWSYYGVLPSEWMAEQEFIVNDQEVTGAEVVSINDHPPTGVELAQLATRNPGLETSKPKEKNGEKKRENF